MTNTNILAFGAGVDSTALLAIDLNREAVSRFLNIPRNLLDEKFPKLDAVVFSDPGAEYPETYDNVEIANKICAENNLRFEKIKKDGENIIDWLDRLGNLPLLPGAGHVCSLKFKGEVLNKFAEKEYEGQIRWSIGIEANEGHRVKRIKIQKGSRHIHTHPLVDLNLTREDCIQIIEKFWPVSVTKSSCFFCPFASEEEIKNLHDNYPELWDRAKQIEVNFKATSKIKNQRWIDNGRKLNKAGRANKGEWREDSYAKGARLFARAINGRVLSVDEWEAKVA
tara:strand:- start:2162 stop:3004 length:843 start_codon:yes stop_codon:yes gene_type:complete